MSITEKMRKAFDACTVMAGVEPDFECVYMTKDAALLYLDEIDAENAKLLEQIHWLKQGDILHVLTDQEYIDQCERERLMQVSIDALDKENAKLREELADAPKCETCEAMLDCDECLRADGSHKERRRLKAENTELRESVKRLMTQRDERLARAETDNAELRELIRELFRDFANADYELKSRCGRTFMAVTRYLPRLQELEVEP